jgi:hypothetical protein
MSQSLRESGFTVEEYVFSETSIDRLAALTMRLFADRLIDIPDVDEYVEELKSVILKTTPSGRARIDHYSGKHDDQVVATALAAHWLMAQPFYDAPLTSNAGALAGATLRRAEPTVTTATRPRTGPRLRGGPALSPLDRLARVQGHGRR